MIGCLFGSAIIGGSGMLIAKSMRASAEINEKKEKMITNVVPFSGLAKLPTLTCTNGVMTVIDNKEKAGILEVLQKRTDSRIKTVIDSNFNVKHVSMSERKFWEPQFFEKINLNLGVSNFVPPENVSKILFDANDVVSYSAPNSQALATTLKQNYGVNFSLPQSGKYAAKFSSLEGKPVYAFGVVKTNGTNQTFNASIMATDLRAIVNEVFKNDESGADLTFSTGVLGVVAGAVIIGISASN